MGVAYATHFSKLFAKELKNTRTFVRVFFILSYFIENCDSVVVVNQEFSMKIMENT